MYSILALPVEDKECGVALAMRHLALPVERRVALAALPLEVGKTKTKGCCIALTALPIKYLMSPFLLAYATLVGAVFGGVVLVLLLALMAALMSHILGSGIKYLYVSFGASG